jgi:hypothetical protein
MRCTDCNHDVKPVVAIDIDGTLGDYHSHFMTFAERWVGRQVSWTYDGTQPMREWFCEAYGCDVQLWRDCKLAYRQGGLKRWMPIYNGTYDLCHGVRNAGAELWLTTTRPYLRLDNVDPDTREWLSRWDIDFDYMVYDEGKYGVLEERVGADRVVAVLDDLSEQYLDAAVRFGSEVPILRRTKWNRAAPASLNSVLNLRDARTAIQERINQWGTS